MWRLLFSVIFVATGCEPVPSTPLEPANTLATPRSVSGPNFEASPGSLRLAPVTGERTSDPAHLELEADPTHGMAPLLVRFRVLGVPDGNPLRWTYGDGFAEQNVMREVVHRYERPEEYLVTVDDMASGQTSTAWIRVAEAPLDVDIEAVPDIVDRHRFEFSSTLC